MSTTDARIEMFSAQRFIFATDVHKPCQIQQNDQG